MNFELKILVGEQEITIKEDAEDHMDFFSKISFFSTLPKVGPNGGKKLKFVHRTPKGFDYYSIVDEETNMELKFGISKENPGCLFTKNWEPIMFNNSNQDTNDSGELIEAQIVPSNRTVVANPVNTPVAPRVSVQVPKAQIVPATIPVAEPVIEATVPQQIPMANTNAVNNILAKYGISHK